MFLTKSSPSSYSSVLLALGAIAIALCSLRYLPAQNQIVMTDQERPILEQLRGLRHLPDDERARTTKELAIRIRDLPASPNKLRLANGLASLSTEGDFGHDTLQEVATTLADALLGSGKENADPKQLGTAYAELASLVRYEHVDASLMADVPQFREAMAKLETEDQARQRADFTLTDLNGKEWTLKRLQGKVVVVNFWATWCPPCRKEMPDLDALYQRFENEGLVILAISDESVDKVRPFIAEKNISYPILLDPERKVHELFQVEGIPKSFFYNRDGKLVAQSIDMGTRKQFLEMFAQAGLH
jgi:peroxiredoxin